MCRRVPSGFEVIFKYSPDGLRRAAIEVSPIFREPSGNGQPKAKYWDDLDEWISARIVRKIAVCLKLLLGSNAFLLPLTFPSKAVQS